MRVNGKVLVDFLNRVTIGGSIDDCVLRFEPNGLNVTVRDLSSVGAVNGVLNKEGNFQDYKDGLEIPVADTGRLLSILKLIDGAAEIVVEDDTFRLIGESVEGSMKMKKREFVHCDVPADKWPQLGYDESDEFEIDAGIFDVARKSIGELTKKSMGDTQNRHLVAAVRDGLFTLQAGEDTGDKIIAKVPVNFGKEASADYGEAFLEFVTVMKGSLKIAFRDDYPIVIKSRDNNSEITWLVSPILPLGEEEVKENV